MILPNVDLSPTQGTTEQANENIAKMHSDAGRVINRSNSLLHNEQLSAKQTLTNSISLLKDGLQSNKLDNKKVISSRTLSKEDIENLDKSINTYVCIDSHNWDKYNRKNNYFLYCIYTICLCAFLVGWNTSILNTCIDYIAWDFAWCKDDDKIINCNRYDVYSSFLKVSVLIGAAIGAITSRSYYAYGRRTILMIASLIFFITQIGCVVSDSFYPLFVFRLVLGYAIGLISCIGPTYISELALADVRGFYGVLYQVSNTIGIVLSIVIGIPLSATQDIPDEWGKITTFNRIWWRIMLGLGSILAIIVWILLKYVINFDTPSHYIETGNDHAAKKVLQILHRREAVDIEYIAIKSAITESNKHKKENFTIRRAWLTSAEYKKMFFFTLLFSVFQQFTGINVFIISSNQLFLDAGLSGIWPTIVSSILTLSNFVMNVVTVFIIDKCGRRKLMNVGIVGMALSVLPAAIAYWSVAEDSNVCKSLAIIGSILFMLFFAGTYGPVLWVYLFEVYPENIRAKASSLAVAVNWTSAIIIVFIAQYLSNRYNFTIFTIMGILASWLIISMMKETKGLQIGTSPYITKPFSTI